MTDDATEIDLLRNISRQLDIMTMVLLDLRMTMTGMQDSTVAISEQLPTRQASPQSVRTTLGEAQVIDGDGVSYIRQPLPGKHWLMVTINTNDQSIQSMKIETPNGEQFAISEEELVETFGPIRLPLPQAMAQKHPTDTALNPDVEVRDERSGE